jgi:hypothetical protein
VPAHSAISPLATATQNQPLYPALPAAYIIRQMVAFKNGERTGGRAPVMIAMAKVLTDADVKIDMWDDSGENKAVQPALRIALYLISADLSRGGGRRRGVG